MALGDPRLKYNLLYNHRPGMVHGAEPSLQRQPHSPPQIVLKPPLVSALQSMLTRKQRPEWQRDEVPK